jgi:uncharacterized repeat protein (TIGR02543 family)
MYLSIKTHIFRIRYLIALLLFLMFWIGGGSEARADTYMLYAFFNYSQNTPLTQDFVNQHSLTINFSCNGKYGYRTITVNKNSIRFGSRNNYPLSTVASHSNAWDDIIPNGKTVAYYQVAMYSATSWSWEEVCAEQYYLEGYTLDGVYTSLHKKLSLTHYAGVHTRKDSDAYIVLDSGSGSITLKPGFNVYYNYNGGSGPQSSVQNTTHVALPSPHSRTGYSFAGWYDGGTWVGGSGGGYNVTKNVWLTAHWNINSYYLDLNGSGSAISNTGGISPAGLADVYINGNKVQSNVGDYWASHTYGTTYKIDLKEVPGYTFNNISVTSQGTNGSNSISGATVTGKIGAGQTTIVGNYSPNSYTVEYYTNDGTGTNGEGTKIASETWSYAAEKTLQGQGTLQRVYAVSYDTNVENTSHSKPAQPVQQTYTYVPLGWSTNQKAVKADYAFGAAANNLTTEKNGVVKMYAVWGPQSTEFKLPTPVRHGYTFEGWYDGDTRVGNGGDTIYKPTKDTTLTAHWSKPITYHAYYSVYGGSAEVRKDFTVEDTFTLNAPTIKNYTFLGWTGGTDPQDQGAWGMNKAQEFTNATPITVPVGTYGDLFFRAVYRPTSQYLHDYPSGNVNAYYAESSSQEIKY